MVAFSLFRKVHKRQKFVQCSVAFISHFGCWSNTVGVYSIVTIDFAFKSVLTFVWFWSKMAWLKNVFTHVRSWHQFDWKPLMSRSNCSTSIYACICSNVSNSDYIAIVWCRHQCRSMELMSTVYTWVKPTFSWLITWLSFL